MTEWREQGLIGDALLSDFSAAAETCGGDAGPGSPTPTPEEAEPEPPRRRSKRRRLVGPPSQRLLPSVARIDRELRALQRAPKVGWYYRHRRKCLQTVRRRLLRMTANGDELSDDALAQLQDMVASLRLRDE